MLHRVGSVCPVVYTATRAVWVPRVLAEETALLKTVTVRLPSVSGVAFCLPKHQPWCCYRWQGHCSPLLLICDIWRCQFLEMSLLPVSLL